MNGVVIGLCIASYLIGAIPFALIVSKAKGVDLRKQGSGNIGATNVMRVMGWKYALPVFVLDGLKGFFPTYYALLLSDLPYVHVLVGFLAIVGHSLTIFAGFKGGKGAATGLGVLAALSPDVFGIIFCLAAILIGWSRYVAPVTILCSILAPILLYLFNYPISYTLFVGCISLFIVVRHKDNIKRLIQGKENRF